MPINVMMSSNMYAPNYNIQNVMNQNQMHNFNSLSSEPNIKSTSDLSSPLRYLSSSSFITSPQCILLSLCLITITIGLTTFNMLGHLKHFTRPHLQKHVLRILLVTPIIVVFSFLALITDETASNNQENLHINNSDNTVSNFDYTQSQQTGTGNPNSSKNSQNTSPTTTTTDYNDNLDEPAKSRARPVLLIFRDFWEAVVIYSFFMFILETMGGEHLCMQAIAQSGEQTSSLFTRPVEEFRWPWPIVLLMSSPVIPPEQLIRLPKNLTLQFVFIRPIMSIFELSVYVQETKGSYSDNEVKKNIPAAIFINLVYNASYSAALFGLYLIYTASKNHVALQKRYCILKFLSVKMVVFLTFWQTYLFPLFITSGNSERWQDFVLIAECSFFTICMTVAFSYREFKEENVTEQLRVQQVNSGGSISQQSYIGGVGPGSMGGNNNQNLNNHCQNPNSNFRHPQNVLSGQQMYNLDPTSPQKTPGQIQIELMAQKTGINYLMSSSIQSNQQQQQGPNGLNNNPTTNATISTEYYSETLYSSQGLSAPNVSVYSGSPIKNLDNLNGPIPNMVGMSSDSKVNDNNVLDNNQNFNMNDHNFANFDHFNHNNDLNQNLNYLDNSFVTISRKQRELQERGKELASDQHNLVNSFPQVAPVGVVLHSSVSPIKGTESEQTNGVRTQNSIKPEKQQDQIDDYDTSVTGQNAVVTAQKTTSQTDIISVSNSLPNAISSEAVVIAENNDIQPNPNRHDTKESSVTSKSSTGTKSESSSESQEGSQSRSGTFGSGNNAISELSKVTAVGAGTTILSHGINTNSQQQKNTVQAEPATIDFGQDFPAEILEKTQTRTSTVASGGGTGIGQSVNNSNVNDSQQLQSQAVSNSQSMTTTIQSKAQNIFESALTTVGLPQPKKSQTQQSIESNLQNDKSQSQTGDGADNDFDPNAPIPITQNIDKSDSNKDTDSIPLWLKNAQKALNPKDVLLDAKRSLFSQRYAGHVLVESDAQDHALTTIDQYYHSEDTNMKQSSDQEIGEQDCGNKNKDDSANLKGSGSPKNTVNDANSRSGSPKGLKSISTELTATDSIKGKEGQTYQQIPQTKIQVKTANLQIGSNSNQSGFKTVQQNQIQVPSLGPPGSVGTGKIGPPTSSPIVPKLQKSNDSFNSNSTQNSNQNSNSNSPNSNSLSTLSNLQRELDRKEKKGEDLVILQPNLETTAGTGSGTIPEKKKDKKKNLQKLKKAQKKILKTIGGIAVNIPKTATKVVGGKKKKDKKQNQAKESLSKTSQQSKKYKSKSSVSSKLKKLKHNTDHNGSENYISRSDVLINAKDDSRQNLDEDDDKPNPLKGAIGANEGVVITRNEDEEDESDEGDSDSDENESDSSESESSDSEGSSGSEEEEEEVDDKQEDRDNANDSTNATVADVVTITKSALPKDPGQVLVQPGPVIRPVTTSTKISGDPEGGI